MSSSSSNKQPLMVDRPATTSTLLTVASGQDFSTNLVPTAVVTQLKSLTLTQAPLIRLFQVHILMRFGCATPSVVLSLSTHRQ